MRKWLTFSLSIFLLFACDPETKTKVEICNNNLDDDGDGLVDCADPGCYALAGGPTGQLCQSTETRCDDGFDNDADGQTDCDDTDCAAACGAVEDCDNGSDDDGDGDVDCADDDCLGTAACLGPVEDCDVAGDEDNDGLADCADPECNNQVGPGGGTCQTTETSCADNYDNDGDGQIDCADSDCAAECLTGGALVITEIMKDPNVAADSAGEWFEITNTSAGAVNLQGLVIFSASSGGEETHVIASPLSVAAGARVVLGPSADPLLNGGVTVHYAYTGITFNNTSDDELGLRTVGGTIIDRVAFGASTFPGFAGWSMQLDTAHTNAADNDNAANWCASRVKFNAFDQGTPGSANHTCAVETLCNDSLDNDGDGNVDCADFACANAANCSTAAAAVSGSLIVTEIMANPGIGTPNFQYEWFEVHNTTLGAVELNGLTICDDTPTRYCFLVHFGVSTPLAAGAKAIFVSDDSMWTGHAGALFEYGPAIQLGNTADALQVFRGAALIDAVTYDAAWPFATAGVAVQFSASATHNSTANDARANWCVAVNEYDTVNHLFGTPGAANRDCNVQETICNDGLDNDGDGQTDCADANCVGQPGPGGVLCQATETTCDDGFDNDGDGLVDCLDPNCAGLPGPGGVNCPSGSMTLFFSEYIEGSGSNKALEIYNPLSIGFDLSACRVNLYSNGSSAVSNFVALSGSLAAGEVFVICNASSNALILAQCDLQNSATANFNGDDAVELVCGGVTLDVIGQIGFDPGTEWVNGGVSTLNQSLVRKCGITTGDTVRNDAFDPSVEWNSFPQDTFTNLGSHTVSCK
jgi:hypothetical protein